MKTKTPTILAIDFDDTIARTNFPTILKARRGAKKYINKLYEEGYYIIIWTCRHGEHEKDAKKWLWLNEIDYHRINQHHPALIEVFKNDTRKISADIYIDDKALSIFPIPCWFILYWKIKIKSFFIKKKKFLNLI